MPSALDTSAPHTIEELLTQVKLCEALVKWRSDVVGGGGDLQASSFRKKYPQEHNGLRGLLLQRCPYKHGQYPAPVQWVQSLYIQQEAGQLQNQKQEAGQLQNQKAVVREGSDQTKKAVVRPSEEYVPVRASGNSATPSPTTVTSSSTESGFDKWYKQKKQQAHTEARDKVVDKALKVAKNKAETAINREAMKSINAAVKSAIKHTVNRDDDFHSPASVQRFIDLRLNPKVKLITPSLRFALGKSPLLNPPLITPRSHRSPSTKNASRNIRTSTMRCAACSFSAGAWLRCLHTRRTRRGPWSSPLLPPQ